MAKLNWKNLLDTKCPKCSGKLELNSQIEQYLCVEECGFGGIYQKNFNDLVNKMYRKKSNPIREYEDMDRSHFS